MNETTLTSDFQMDGDNLSLDFANTSHWHASTQPQEKLTNYSDLVAWSMTVNVLDERKARHLLTEAENHPEEVSSTLGKAIELRETIYRIFTAVADMQEPAGADLKHLSKAYAEAVSRAQLVPTPIGFDWRFGSEKGPFDQMLWPIARSAVELLTAEGLERVGQCADDRGCGWLFIDTSRNQRRRWCSMDSCGNRAKARRHYQRKTKKSSP